MRVLMSAYACEPGKGSEPEVGWRAAMAMSASCDVKVITRANNQSLIDEAMRDVKAGPEFLYYDLPKLFLWLKKRFGMVAFYYFLWQIAVRFVFRKVLKEVDVVHHVTFNGAQIPGFWVATDTPVVLGPLGGGMTCPVKLLPILGKDQRAEKFRSLMIHRLSWIPWWAPAIANAKVVLAANRETAETLANNASIETPVMLETAIDEAVLERERVSESSLPEFTFLWLGGLIPRKAGNLAILALSKAIQKGAKVNLWFAGGGSEEMKWKELASKEGLGDRVRFLGRIQKAEVNSVMDEVSALIFTSVRDTSGNVVLEAMSRSLPVLAVHHQGVREMCDDSCAVLVEPGTVKETVEGLADGMKWLVDNPDLAKEMGLNGSKRVADQMTWSNYERRMFGYYLKAIRDQ